MPDASEHFRLQELAEGVWVALASARGYGLCNAGIVDLGGTTVVFDAMLTPQAGEALGKAASRLTGRPVGLVANSHYHGDHVRGNGAIGAAHVVSTRRVRELIIERGPLHLRSDLEEAPTDLERLRAGELGANDFERVVYEGWFKGILATPKDLTLRAPDVTFETELTLHGTRRTARLVTFGGGHSPSDVLLQLPDERIVYFGDLLSVGFHPSLSDGVPEELPRILTEARALGVRVAVPGHGTVSGDEAVVEMIRYVRRLQEESQKAREAGIPRDDWARRPPPAPYEAWAFSSIYEANARFLYDRRPGPAGLEGP